MTNVKICPIILLLSISVILSACSAQPSYLPAPQSIDGFQVSAIRLSNGDVFVPNTSPGSSCDEITAESQSIEKIMKSDISTFRSKGAGEAKLAGFYLHLLSSMQAKC